jgi:hypothetical protein
LKETYLLIIGLLFFMISASPQSKFPEAEISNGLLKVHFYLPKVKQGYYQATSFDWSAFKQLLNTMDINKNMDFFYH